jgi:hypothetical protein
MLVFKRHTSQMYDTILVAASESCKSLPALKIGYSRTLINMMVIHYAYVR